MNNFDGYIFDLDGTLIDSNGVWKKIDEIILQKLHIRTLKPEECAALDYEDFHKLIISKGADCTLEWLKNELDTLAVKEYRYNIFIKAGVREYLQAVKNSGGKIALATASPKRLYEPVLRNNSIYGMFDAFITTDEAGSSKDYPDIYLKAAELLEVFPDKCVVFEDVLKGIFSAKTAGMYAVAVYDKYSTDDIVTMRQYADEFIFSFEDMPLFNGTTI